MQETPQPHAHVNEGVAVPAPVEVPVARIGALSLRALAVGLICVAITCCVVCYAELVVGKIQIGFLQLPPVVVGMLTLLLVMQATLAQFSQRFRLRTHELFILYVMMLLAAMVSSRGLLEKLIPLLVVPNYDANAGNNWQGLFFAFIPRWAVPFDPAGEPKQVVAARFFDALRAGERIPWGLWVVPLLAWGIFVALIFTAFLCLAVLLRRQWVDNEKLTFPLVHLPLEMIRAGAPVARGMAQDRSQYGSVSLLQNRITWLGFALPAFVFGFNGLHQWYPSVPEIQTDISVNAYFVEPPWNGLSYTHLFLSFAAVGFFYLLPTDLPFSLWFFFVLTRVEDVVAASLGYQPETMPLYPCRLFIAYQVMGAYVVLVGYIFWTARPHLACVWRAAFQRPKTLAAGSILRSENDADEVLSYRAAFWGLLGSILLSAGWLWLFGMSYWLALFELMVLLFVVAIVMARSTCESGMLMTETSFRPVDMLRMVTDVRYLGNANLTAMAFLDALWMRDQRGLVLTGFLDSMKLADGVRVRRSSLLGIFGLAIVVAVMVSGFLHISLPYRLGAVQMYSYVYRGNPVWAFSDSAAVLNGSRPPLSWIGPLNFSIGALLTVVIVGLRARLLWFPLHPLGYALSSTWTLIVFWFPCLVAWLCKLFILRYGGMNLYVRARPFFLGMVLGEFTMAVLWTLPSLFWRTPTPAFPWP